ncbi:MAG: hypothetical protein AVDCRST_MAG87-3732, partial [uncultured Thermomicrobiales bacterium]
GLPHGGARDGGTPGDGASGAGTFPGQGVRWCGHPHGFRFAL